MKTRRSSHLPPASRDTAGDFEMKRTPFPNGRPVSAYPSCFLSSRKCVGQSEKALTTKGGLRAIGYLLPTAQIVAALMAVAAVGAAVVAIAGTPHGEGSQPHPHPSPHGEGCECGSDRSVDEPHDFYGRRTQTKLVIYIRN